MGRLIALFALAVATTAPAQDPPKPEPTPTRAEKNSYLDNAKLIVGGLNMLKGDKGLNLALNTSIDFRPNFHAVFAPRTSLVNFELGLGERLRKEQAAVQAQLQRETNDLLKLQLEVQSKQLEVQIEQARIAEEHRNVARHAHDHAVRAFEYQKKKDDAVLRRLEYTFRPGKLVVVVADFSCGGTSEGVEIADEVANALREMRQKCGIDVEILAGEIRPGVVIRSEQLALDVGQHFPKGTSYAVIWGTLSPRTVGKFRPHVTCAVKVDDERGVSTTYTIDPDSQPLPKQGTPDEQRREEHEKLIAFACAVLPGCYASYEITQDRAPDLDTFLAFLEKGDEEARKVAAQYRRDLEPLTRWINARPRDKAKQEYLRRLTPVSRETVFPRLVVNTRDNSLMTLVTEPGTEIPKRFKDADGEYLAYIDVTETTNRQFLAYLNANGNQNKGGAPDILLDIPAGDPRPRNILRQPDGTFAVGVPALDLERPVLNVSYLGAERYCEWAGKQVPRLDEWRAAAQRAKKDGQPWAESTFVWGSQPGEWWKYCANRKNPAAIQPDPKQSPGTFPTHRVGSFPTDRSGIGCLDIAGNVSEWVQEFAPGSATDRLVCGGNWNDENPEMLAIKHVRSEPQTNHTPHIGFRGVVRVRVPAEPKP